MSIQYHRLALRNASNTITIVRTLVFQEVTHPRPTRQHQLSYVLDYLGFLLLRHCLEPFREADLACSTNELSVFTVYIVPYLVETRAGCS